MYVLDSSALIEATRKQGRFEKVLLRIGEAPLVTTSISVHELFVGAKTEKQRFMLKYLFTGMRILPHDEEAGKLSGQLEQELIATGKMIETPDILIAGICKLHDAELVTFDSDFTHIKGLNMHLIK